LLQTLFFKFTRRSGVRLHLLDARAEPWGRIGSGVVELIAALLLLYPPTITIGAIVSLGVISGAILTHLTVLGIEVQGGRRTAVPPGAYSVSYRVRRFYFCVAAEIPVLGVWLASHSLA
jgi:hypothetical protein